MAEGVQFVNGRVFTSEVVGEGPRPAWGPVDSPFLRLAFSYVAEAEIAEGVRRLGAAMTAAAAVTP